MFDIIHERSVNDTEKCTLKLLTHKAAKRKTPSFPQWMDENKPEQVCVAFWSIWHKFDIMNDLNDIHGTEKASHHEMCDVPKKIIK